MAGEEGASFTLSQEELYRLGLSFYKEQEGKGLQVEELLDQLQTPRSITITYFCLIIIEI